MGNLLQLYIGVENFGIYPKTIQTYIETFRYSNVVCGDSKITTQHVNPISYDYTAIIMTSSSIDTVRRTFRDHRPATSSVSIYYAVWEPLAKIEN